MRRTVLCLLLSAVLLLTSCRRDPDMPAQGVLASASPAAETESWSGIDLFASVKTLLPAEPSPPPRETAQPDTPPEAAQPEYKAFKCRRISFSDTLQTGITFASGGRRLALPLPEDWIVEAMPAPAMDILYQGSRIGTISRTQPYTAVEKYELRAWVRENLQAERAVCKVIEDGKTVYKRLYSFTDTLAQSTIYVSVDYTALDDAMFFMLFENAAISAETGGAQHISLFPQNGSDQILILGNSFIATSEIGSFLEQFLIRADKPYTLRAVSRGYASVEDYAQEEWLQAIREGRYCAVFQCGLYAPNDVDQFVKVKQACSDSYTRLVLFPAHNENKSFIRQIEDRHPEVICLNWQEEINRLIKSSQCRAVYRDFCIDDAHQHTTPLGGYVGAHLIYRALFQEIPPYYVGETPLSMESISFYLGSYTDTGKAEEIKFERMYSLR